MTAYNIGTWINKKTGLGYSGPKQNINDLPASAKTGKPIIQIKPTETKIGIIDFAKEIPEATKTVITGIAKFGREVQKGIAKSGASVALTLTAPFTGQETISDEKLSPDLRVFKNIIFGKDELKSLQTRIAEAEISTQRFGEKYGIKPIEKGALPLAFAGVGAVISLDFVGGGGKDTVIKTLTKLNNTADIANVLKRINVADDLIKNYAPKIAKTAKADDVVKILNRIDDLQKTAKITKPLAQEFTPKELQEKLDIAKNIYEKQKIKVPRTKARIDYLEQQLRETLPLAQPLQATKERQFLQSVRDARPDIPLKVGGQYIPRSTDELAIKAKNLIKDNIETAEQIVKTGTDENAVATASELIKHYSDEALKTTDIAVKNTLYDKASEIAHIAAENLTEQGRAVQAASIMGRLTPEGILRFAAKEINKYNEAIEKSKGIFGLKNKIPKLTPEQTQFILDGFKKIEIMPDGTQKAIAFKQLNDAISDLIPSSLYQKIVSVWKAGLLTGIKTSGLNTFSNLFHGVSETIKDIPAMAVDSVASLFTGKRTLGLTVKGTPTGIKEGFKKGWTYLNTGFDERNVAVKLDWKKVNFGKGKFAKGIQKYEETIFHILGAEDQPFYYGAKARSLQSQAIAQAKNLKLTGAKAKTFIENLVSNPTDKMLKYAMNDAEIAVFQNPTTLGKIAKAIQKAPAGEFVVPFGRTPSAVATQLINYSPVGIVKTIIENIGKGKFDQRLFVQGIGRGITGSAIMAIGAKLFKNKMINLSYPKGEREQKLWEIEGRTPNTIKIGNKWRNLNILGPAGMVILAGGNYQKALEETGSHFSALTTAMAGSVKSLSEQTFLQGLNQVLAALNEPNKLESYFSNIAASIIPTIIGDVAKAADVAQRRTPKFFDKLKAKIPGWRQTLEPTIDILGQEKQRGGNWIETMIDPSRPSKIISGNIAQELRRLFDAGFEVSPTLLGTKEGYKGLTPEENTALWQRTGELMNSKLNNLFNMEQYKKLSDEEKGKLIENIIDKAKSNARVQAVMELTEGLTGQELKNKLSELKVGGLMTQEVFKLYLKMGVPTIKPTEKTTTTKEQRTKKAKNLINEMIESGQATTSF